MKKSTVFPLSLALILSAASASILSSCQYTDRSPVNGVTAIYNRDTKKAKIPLKDGTIAEVDLAESVPVGGATPVPTATPTATPTPGATATPQPTATPIPTTPPGTQVLFEDQAATVAASPYRQHTLTIREGKIELHVNIDQDGNASNGDQPVFFYYEVIASDNFHPTGSTTDNTFNLMLDKQSQLQSDIVIILKRSDGTIFWQKTFKKVR